MRWSSFEKEHQENLYVYGNLLCNVRCFEYAVELNFPFDERTGAAVATDPETAFEFYSFLRDCLEELNDIEPARH